MIKFFAKTRQRLLTETPPAGWAGKFSKYLLYAIGEIILVVIGILIALQVNNLNQLSRERDAERKFLKQIREDLNRSRLTMEETAEFFFEKAKAASYVTNAFWNPESVIIDSLAISMGSVMQSRRENPLVGTMESLVNSGEINIIRSDSLRNAIISYLGIVKSLISDIERYDETYYRPAIHEIGHLVNYPEIFREFGSNRRRKLSPYPPTITTIPFRNDYNAFLKDRDIFTEYNQLLVAHRNQSSRYSNLADESEKLVKSIDTYLRENE